MFVIEVILRLHMIESEDGFFYSGNAVGYGEKEYENEDMYVLI